MAFFFFFIGLELKKEIADGSLSNRKEALLPCIAALGGMVVPMLVYLIVNLTAKTGSLAGVTVPMATDIAFACGVFSLCGGARKLPAAVTTFLLTLATVDDLGAIIVIATCLGGHLSPLYLAGAALVQGVHVAMDRAVVSSGKTYLATGCALWYCLLRSGINADMAGVLAGLSVHASKGDTKIIDRLVRRFIPICGLFVMPLFALANTAIPLLPSVVAAAAPLTTEASPALAVAAGIFAGLVLGKPLGILGFSLLAVKSGIAQFPQGMNAKHVGVVGCLGGIGFTMCIFLIEQALPLGRIATLSKVAVLAASVTAAALGALLVSTIEEEPSPKEIAA